MSVQGVARSEVCDRLANIDEKTCQEWGGKWLPAIEKATVKPLPIEAPYDEPTRVESVADANLAFEKYTRFFEYVLENHTESNDEAVLLPCGSQKPIGASGIHQKKLNALENAGYTSDCDIAIVSEPCTIIPHDMRLSRPAVNYDFPPKYTEAARAPEVFDVFTTRLSTWLDHISYSRIYAYLVKGHMNKLEAALSKANSPPEIITIPGASLNPDTENYSGDLFKSTEDVSKKLSCIRASIRSDEDHEDSQELVEFYSDKYSVL